MGHWGIATYGNKGKEFSGENVIASNWEPPFEKEVRFSVAKSKFPKFHDGKPDETWLTIGLIPPLGLQPGGYQCNL